MKIFSNTEQQTDRTVTHKIKEINEMNPELSFQRHFSIICRKVLSELIRNVEEGWGAKI